MFLSSAAQANSRLLRASTQHVSRRFMSVITLSDEEAVEKFRVVNSKSVLYFTAVWCPPCKVISPVYEKMSENFPDIAFGKVDIDKNDGAATDFEVQAVPTFVLFDGETAIEKFSGADQTKLESLVKDLESR